MKMKELIKRLKQWVSLNKTSYYPEDPEERDWGMQIGVLISYNEAEEIVNYYEKVNIEEILDLLSEYQMCLDIDVNLELLPSGDGEVVKRNTGKELIVFDSLEELKSRLKEEINNY